MVILAERAVAESSLAKANNALARTLRRLLADGVGIEGISQLVELAATEVGRLTKLSTDAGAQAAPA